MQYYHAKTKRAWIISFDEKTHRYVLWTKNSDGLVQNTTSAEIEKLINKIPDHKTH